MSIYTLNISEHLMSALINGDDSGLESDDLKALDEAIEFYGPKFHVICPSDFEASFMECDITGMYSNCIECDVEVSI